MTNEPRSSGTREASDAVRPDFGRALHVAGKSTNKNTEAVLQCWLANDGLPPLTVVAWGPLIGRIERRWPEHEWPSNVTMVRQKMPLPEHLKVDDQELEAYLVKQAQENKLVNHLPEHLSKPFADEARKSLRRSMSSRRSILSGPMGAANKNTSVITRARQSIATMGGVPVGPRYLSL